MDLLIEQMTIAQQGRFGRSTEKIDWEGQLEMLFNEAEMIIVDKYVIESCLEEVCSVSEDELKGKFGDSWRRLPDEVYKRLAFHPATFEVEEHHVAIYCGSDNETIVKAPRPVSLLRNSIVTPSLEATILNGKYVNALPLYRM